MKQHMLTTIDNPFNPFTQYDEWRSYDEDEGYFTNEYLARIATISSQLTDEMYDAEFERAIDEIVKLNLLGIYKKVTKEDYKDGKWKPYKLKEGVDY